MERLHAAVTGTHNRHGQLLPLEAYLEEGIPLVLALREGPPEMVELPEQSMHAFITWANAASPHPALKARPAPCMFGLRFCDANIVSMIVLHFQTGRGERGGQRRTRGALSGPMPLAPTLPSRQVHSHINDILNSTLKRGP